MKYLILLILFPIALFSQSDDNIVVRLRQNVNLTEYDRPDEIIKFNKDTILIAGYLEDLSDPEVRYKKQTNVIYKTCKWW